MNGTCAGGTGSFLDQMAVLLNTTTDGLNSLANNGITIYPIASRCGVFAKADVQPLLNEGAKKEDIALSIMQAVVNQTISGLACGKPIKGNVLFLGGPLTYLDSLRNRFISTLDLKENEIVKTNIDTKIFVCIGAILDKEKKKTFDLKGLQSLKKKLSNFTEEESNNLEPLFKNEKDYKKFLERHKKASIKKSDLSKYKGDIFVGIDAGSTTCKVVAIGSKKELLYENYQSNKGTPFDTVKNMLLDLYDNLPNDVVIRQSGSTGKQHLI